MVIFAASIFTLLVTESSAELFFASTSSLSAITAPLVSFTAPPAEASSVTAPVTPPVLTVFDSVTLPLSVVTVMSPATVVMPLVPNGPEPISTVLAPT